MCENQADAASVVPSHGSLYTDDSELTAAQAAAVISENSGYHVSTSNLSHRVLSGEISARRFGRSYRYKYQDIKDKKYSRYHAGRKRKK